MNNHTPSQNARILSYLKEHGTLTAIEALNLFQCLRLASRINQLKEQGHIIQSELVETKGGKHVSQYTLIKEAA